MDRIGNIVAPVPRFWAALIALPGFLLIDNLLLKLIITVFYSVLTYFSGRKIRWTFFIILIISITFFHLLIPMGRVLVRFGSFVITEEALNRGLIKGIGLTGMVLLSTASIRPELINSGALGGLLGRSFYYFYIIIEGKSQLSWKNFFESLDRLLLEKFDFQSSRQESIKTPDSAQGSAGLGWAIAMAMGPWILCWLQIYI